MDADPGVIRAAAFPQQVADRVRAAIDRGEWEPGTPLPAERLMAERYKVSIGVLRQGLAILTAEGLLIKAQGARTLVRGRPGPPQSIPRTAADPWTELTPVGESEHLRGAAKPRMAKLLGLPEGSSIFIVHQAATHTTGRPVLTCRVLPTLALDGIDPKTYPDPFGPRQQIITALTTHHGPLTATEHVRPLMPDSDERDTLKLRPGDLLLEAVRVTRNTERTGLIAESQRYGEGIELEYPLI